MYAGVFAIVLLLGKYHASTAGDYDFTTSSRFGWAFAHSALLCVAAYGLGLPEVPRTLRSRLPTSLSAAFAGALAMSVVQLFAGDALLPRFVVLGSAMLAVPWFYAMSTVAKAGRTSLERRDRVMVVGPAELAAELTAELAGSPEKPASVVTHLAEEPAADLSGEQRPLVEAVLEHGVTVLVLSGPAQSDDRIVEQAAFLHETGVRVRTQSLFYEEWLGKIPVADLGRVSLFFDIGEVHRIRFGRTKRLVDIAAGLFGVVVLAVAIPFVLIGNVVANRGPLFYAQERVGRGGAVFRILKFRSMTSDASVPTDWTAEDDPRITRFGRILRITHLDELPQVWNILRGDLSLVGPRPEQPRYVSELVEKLPFYDLRHIVRPGLTGWAQVKYGYAGDERDALEKLQYDFHYLRRQGLGFDLKIVGRTTRSILGIEGRGR
jgi:lipopolysaccharide/colanic/teichoic acid biosynthesis glycosyltransferase